MQKISLTILFLLLSRLFVDAQDIHLFEKQWLIQNGDTLPFRVLLPENYDPVKKYPLVLFLHGRGESGTDNEKQLTHGAKMFLEDSIRKNYPAIVVFPQCASNSYWSNVQAVTSGSKSGKRSFYFVPEGEPSQSMKMLLGLVYNLQERYPVKTDQLYVMGLSMGGMGTFELVRRMPDVFAAAIPICGGAHPATAPQLVKTKWWIFHGGKDDVVLPIYSEQMFTALKKAKANVQFKLFPTANHNSWDPAFAEPGLLKWLFSQKKK
ncbi:prolyl oligopeptidase family serine peptidase [Sediminibacterium goheungense]|uniref:Putative esterase n=1 Tax=Sediminibacterium goheungense TaxID=1086393 RepID=A0A4V3C3V9_9BACT|nr:prolyl oligopeptidase family serine peptidase [Sediminibacterium goheungense]TDO23608.1 putative esterase [Sediminibacterium goheungense]